MCVCVCVCVCVRAHNCVAYQSLCWLHCFATLSWQISFKYSPLLLSHAHTSVEAWNTHTCTHTYTYTHTPWRWTLHAEGCQLWSASALTPHLYPLLLFSSFSAPSILQHLLHLCFSPSLWPKQKHWSSHFCLFLVYTTYRFSHCKIFQVWNTKKLKNGQKHAPLPNFFLVLCCLISYPFHPDYHFGAAPPFLLPINFLHFM